VRENFPNLEPLVVISACLMGAFGLLFVISKKRAALVAAIVAAVLALSALFLCLISNRK
jgi:hypothetical membrane protein